MKSLKVHERALLTTTDKFIINSSNKIKVKPIQRFAKNFNETGQIRSC